MRPLDQPHAVDQHSPVADGTETCRSTVTLLLS